MNETWQRFEYALSKGHRLYQAIAQRNNDFYLGGGLQWDSSLKQALKEQGKPWIELNLIFSTINAIVGHQTQSRMDIAFKPREEKDQEVADILYKLSMYILDRNRYSWKETDVFTDGLVQQRGYFDIRVDFNENLEGEIKIDTLDPLTVIPDPDASSYDPEDWKDVIVEKFLTLDEIKSLYGLGAYRKVSSRVDTYFSNTVPSSFSKEYNALPYYRNDSGVIYVRVLERQWYKFTPRKFFVDVSGEMVPVPEGMTVKEQKKYAKENDKEIITRTVNRVRWTVATEAGEIFDSWSPYDYFTIVPYFPYFRRGQTRGAVDNLITIQELLNKTYSQILHVVNTTANSGWIVEEDSLSNMDVEDLQDEGATTGLVIEYKKGYAPPRKIDPNQIPTGLTNLVNSAVDMINQVSGITETFKGQQGNEVSGAAIQNRVAQTAVQLAVPIDNLFKTRNILARRLLNLIQQYYTEERVFLIDSKAEEPEEVRINTVDESGRVLNDVTVGKFDVVIADVPTQITFEGAQLAQALEMRKFGVAIPDDEMVLLSTLSRKNEIAQKLRPEASPEEQQLQLKQQQLELEEKEVTIDKLKSEARAKSIEATRKAAEIAREIRESPELATVLDKILDREDSVERQDQGQKLGEVDAPVQQDIFGALGDLPPEATETIPEGDTGL